MSRLPSYIVDLAGKKQLPKSTFVGGGYKYESDLDALVIEHCDVLGNLLAENGFLDGPKLKLLGRQFHKVDVLFAAVDEEDEGEVPTRLVLVEDKLARNPEAKRKIIGQIIDYAGELGSLTAQDLKQYFIEHQSWIENNAEALDFLLKQGKFLLVICGDEIHANLANIVGQLAHRTDRHPTSGMELCVVAMEIYADETHKLLIPHIVGRVTEAERHVRITVEVSDRHGVPVGAIVKASENKTEQPLKIKTLRTPDEWFAKTWLQRPSHSSHQY